MPHMTVKAEEAGYQQPAAVHQACRHKRLLPASECACPQPTSCLGSCGATGAQQQGAAHKAQVSRLQHCNAAAAFSLSPALVAASTALAPQPCHSLAFQRFLAGSFQRLWAVLSLPRPPSPHQQGQHANACDSHPIPPFPTFVLTSTYSRQPPINQHLSYPTRPLPSPARTAGNTLSTPSCPTLPDPCPHQHGQQGPQKGCIDHQGQQHVRSRPKRDLGTNKGRGINLATTGHRVQGPL